MKPGRWMVMLAALSLLYLPLRAQETPPETPAATTATEDAAEGPAPLDEEVEAEEPDDEQDAYEERVSVDNNLSFPVDI